jgi:DNA repair photolyase
MANVEGQIRLFEERPLTVISASRRTDIPAFYMPWLMNCLRKGGVSYPNPVSGRIHTVSLQPDDVHSIVFWSKNYGRFLPHWDELVERGYRFYFHYTITGVPRKLEPHVPDWPQSVEVFRTLAKRASPRHVQWRFDPILFTHEWGAEFYVERFRRIAAALAGATRRCYFSFAIFYDKVKRRLQQAGIRFRDPSLEEKLALVQAMADIADECDIGLYACCEDILVTERVRKAHCVDGDLLAELFQDRPLVSQFRPTREQCGCVASRDIGMYDTCPHGCVYCYANQNRQVALARFRAHDPESDVLVKQTREVRNDSRRLALVR